MRGDPRTHIPKSKGTKLARYTVSCPIAPLHRKQSLTSGLDTQLLFGHQFDVYKRGKIWAWGQARSPVPGSRQYGYVGYIQMKCLTDAVMSSNSIVTSLKAPLFLEANIKSRILKSLPMGALLKTKKTSQKFSQLNSGEYIHNNHIRARKTKTEISDFVAIAQCHSGLPYIWGGTSTEGLDCSGLVQSSLRAAGLDAPRDTDMQQEQLGTHIAVQLSGLKRGDLIFWKGHVGIMTSAKKMIHANAFHMAVETEYLKDAASRIKAGGGGAITAIKRL